MYDARVRSTRGIARPGCRLQECLSTFDERSREKAVKVGWPRFKSRNKGIGGFRLTGSIHSHKKTIQLPPGQAPPERANYLPVGAKVAQATVTERAGRWYVSVQLESEIAEIPAGQDAPIGIDLGIKALATCSDGTSYPNPKPAYPLVTTQAGIQARV